MTIRILYDHQVFSLQNVGGASRYHFELIRYFSSLSSVQTELFLGMTSTTYPFQKLRSSNTHVMGCRAVLNPGGGRYVANEVLGNAIVPFLGKMDIYHPTAYRCMPMVRSRGLVTTHHDCTHERFPSIFRHLKQVLRAKQSLYARADAVICVSEFSRKELLEFYPVDPSKTRVIHHGVRPLPRCPAQARKLHEQVQREYILYVGHRAGYRLFPALLQAFHETRLHTSLDLLVLGGGPLTPEEKDLIAKLDLQDAVVSITGVSEELLAEAYASAKLFVYPSLSEGFGFPPLEAMASGCPVLASYASSIPEVSRDAPFYFDPSDQNSFARALLRAVDDEEARIKAIQRGREVVGEYSWENCGKKTLEVYRECL